MLPFVLKGIFLGFAIAAPVGPIGVLCIRRSLTFGPRYGFFTGMGAATADSLYGLIAGLGLAGVSTALVAHQQWIRLIGGIFLLYLGWRIFSSKPEQANRTPDTGDMIAAYLSAFALTVTNPLTILSFVAAFAGLGLGIGSHMSDGLWLVAGVFMGSTLWWLLLSFGTGSMRHRMSDNHLVWVNRISGIVVLAFGLIALLSLSLPRLLNR